MNLLVQPVIMAGGSGTRLWPLSRAGYPKQFLALSGDPAQTHSLFQQAVTRLSALAAPGIKVTAPMVVGNEEHRFLVLDQLQALGVEPSAALRRLLATPGSLTVNLGTGRGYSVLELVAAYGRASGREIPYQIVPRRPGDVAACYADPALAQQQLGWQARLDLDRMCADSWRWQTMNPNGFSA